MKNDLPRPLAVDVIVSASRTAYHVARALLYVAAFALLVTWLAVTIPEGSCL